MSADRFEIRYDQRLKLWGVWDTEAVAFAAHASTEPGAKAVRRLVRRWAENGTGRYAVR